MQTPDPRIEAGTMGVGPPWQYIPAASEYEARGRVARPLSDDQYASSASKAHDDGPEEAAGKAAEAKVVLRRSQK